MNLIEAIKQAMSVNSLRDTQGIYYKISSSRLAEKFNDFEELAEMASEIETIIPEEHLMPSSGYLIFTNVWRVRHFIEDIPTPPAGSESEEFVAVQAISNFWF